MVELPILENLSFGLKNFYRLEFDSSRSLIYDPASYHKSNSCVGLNYREEVRIGENSTSEYHSMFHTVWIKYLYASEVENGRLVRV